MTKGSLSVPDISSPERSQNQQYPRYQWRRLPLSWSCPGICWFSSQSTWTSSHRWIWRLPQWQTRPAIRKKKDRMPFSQCQTSAKDKPQHVGLQHTVDLCSAIIFSWHYMPILFLSNRATCEHFSNCYKKKIFERKWYWWITTKANGKRCVLMCPNLGN